MHDVLNAQDWELPTELASAVHEELDRWVADKNVARVWARDATLWTGGDEARWLGWLDTIEQQQAELSVRAELATAFRDENVTDLLLLGMGGSSLGPEVIGRIIGAAPGFPRLHVLDSTDPCQVRSVEAHLDLTKTAVIVASKSGTTLEPNIFHAYFFERVKERLGARRAGGRFVAITDPGSRLEQIAARDGFRATVLGVPSIGGRYSVLSPFGTVPCALIGVDLADFLTRASVMATACRADSPTNPGLRLGVALGVAALRGRDKLTIIASPALAPLGAWLEQLIAESTGKSGLAIIPVDLERAAEPDLYGHDRLFVYVRFRPAPGDEEDARVDALIGAGQPVVRIDVGEAYDLAQELFRWEMATAVAGAVMGINPFDQPDVEASKVETRALTDAFEATGKLPPEVALCDSDGLRLFADAANAEALAVDPEASVTEWLRAHFGRLRPGDYFALLAYVEMSDANTGLLQQIRHTVRDRVHVASCLGFGPRFLHSTGQAYKGGPNIGVFLQITCDDAADLPVPGQRYTFGVVKAAQARGDFDVLAGRGRRALRVHMESDVARGLAILADMVTDVLR
ncbi:MAG: bifunctional transaldolase/phosoglucose isomerase [Luteitalea sp.]|nr:bifunctional transaldolase/phosoglucose isomerase [Luteitalea sp.]